MGFRKYTKREYLCIFGVLGLLLWGFAGWGAFRNMQFAEKNIAKTTGYVEGLHHFIGHRYESYVVNFHYVAANLLFFTHENVQEVTWDSLHPGDSIPIKYRSSDPSDYRIDLPPENEHWVEFPCVTGAMAAVFTVVSLVIFRLHRWEHHVKGRLHHRRGESRLRRAIRAGWSGTYKDCPPE